MVPWLPVAPWIAVLTVLLSRGIQGGAPPGKTEHSGDSGRPGSGPSPHSCGASPPGFSYSPCPSFPARKAGSPPHCCSVSVSHSRAHRHSEPGRGVGGWHTCLMDIGPRALECIHRARFMERSEVSASWVSPHPHHSLKGTQVTRLTQC